MARNCHHLVREPGLSDFCQACRGRSFLSVCYQQSAISAQYSYGQNRTVIFLLLPRYSTFQIPSLRVVPNLTIASETFVTLPPSHLRSTHQLIQLCYSLHIILNHSQSSSIILDPPQSSPIMAIWLLYLLLWISACSVKASSPLVNRTESVPPPSVWYYPQWYNRAGSSDDDPISGRKKVEFAVAYREAITLAWFAYQQLEFGPGNDPIFNRYFEPQDRGLVKGNHHIGSV